VAHPPYETSSSKDSRSRVYFVDHLLSADGLESCRLWIGVIAYRVTGEGGHRGALDHGQVNYGLRRRKADRGRDVTVLGPKILAVIKHDGEAGAFVNDDLDHQIGCRVDVERIIAAPNFMQPATIRMLGRD